MKRLNLGCGERVHPDWVNIDFVAAAPGVRAHDLRKGIPYPDESFDVVYHSHVLEHFQKKSAHGFLRECYRVLRPGGILRVALPDLEQIVRGYLEALEKASNGSPGWDDNYDWMVLELYDQAIRERTCGQLVEYFQRDPIPNWDFIYKRWGLQAQILLRDLRARSDLTLKDATPPRTAWGYVARNFGTVLRNRLVRILLGREDWEALLVAKFRRQGEIHFWMYDTYSLGKLLQETGFSSTRRYDANESLIPDWTRFNLDTEPDGTVYKPDSLYMEAQKL
jgi:predicted SAM-dependent methyltransferase